VEKVGLPRNLLIVSAAFKYGDRVYWGSNGAVELCLETMLAIAEERDVGDEPVAAFLREWHTMFFTGAVVALDEVLVDEAARTRFVELLALAMKRMSAEDGGLTPLGRQWVDTTLSELHAVLRAPTVPPA
jgi:hypothetical protein